MHAFLFLSCSYLTRDLAAKEPASTARTYCPGIDILWIRPHKVAKRALVRDFLGAVNRPNLIECLDIR